MSLSNRYPSLEGLPVLITGAGAGIGRAMALAFAGQGASLGLIDRDAAGLERTAGMIAGRVATRVADVTDIEALRGAIAALRAELGPIRILINNAGSDTRHDFRTITPDYWDDRMATNLRHLAFAAQAVTPDMEGAGGGVIINLGSTSWMQGAAGLIAYGTAKAAIGGFTQCLARDLGAAGIRVMCIAPGRTVVERTTTDPVYVAETVGRQAVKYLVGAEDIASLALFLCSDDARIFTGQTIIADGGHLMR